MRLLFLSVLFGPILAAPLAAQNGASAPTSTKAGVYTREQARRGQDIYAGNCRSCHTPESHTGEIFRTRWRGKALSELFSYLSDEMPKADPGSLSAQEYADVLAYLLLMNRMPQGDTDLPADPAAMKSIRIETSMSVRKEP